MACDDSQGYATETSQILLETVGVEDKLINMSETSGILSRIVGVFQLQRNTIMIVAQMIVAQIFLVDCWLNISNHAKEKINNGVISLVFADHLFIGISSVEFLQRLTLSCTTRC